MLKYQLNLAALHSVLLYFISVTVWWHLCKVCHIHLFVTVSFILMSW